MCEPDKRAAYMRFFALFLFLDRDPPIQRIIDYGVVPQFVEALRGDDHSLQYEVARALNGIVRGTPNQAKVAMDLGAIPHMVRLLRSPNDLVKGQSAAWLGNVANMDPGFRDLLLRNQALPALLAPSSPAPTPDTTRLLAFAVCTLCGGLPRPDLALIRPALPDLARHAASPHEVVVRAACRALSCLLAGGGPTDHRRAAIEAGACRGLVELLRNPSPQVHSYVHCRWASVPLAHCAVDTLCTSPTLLLPRLLLSPCAALPSAPFRSFSRAGRSRCRPFSTTTHFPR